MTVLDLAHTRLTAEEVPSFNSAGGVFDLAAPFATPIDFAEIARALAGIRRFTGLGIPVAQHCVIGALAIEKEGGSELEAALYLLHDAHEWAVGDLTRPMQKLLGLTLGVAAVEAAIARIKTYWDSAIYCAAGLPLPGAWTPRWREAVKGMDARMLRAEATDLFGARAARHLPPARYRRPAMSGRLTPWPAAKAEIEFIETLDRLIPQARAGGR